MTKKEMDLLEKVFAAGIEGRMYQGKCKTAAKLAEDGFLERIEIKDRTSLGVLTSNGYVLTHAGRFTYCRSDRCAESPI